jgi:hypothetical protein
MLNQWRQHIFAPLIYVLAAGFFLDHGASLTHRVLGLGTDPFLIMWFLGWWPYAFLHGLSLHTGLVWQPLGVDLAWTTSVLFLAVLAAPITVLAGPVLAYNCLTLAAPVLAAWGAYALCWHFTRKASAAFIGGLVFGFSSYEMGQCFDHLNLDFCAAIPMLVLVACRRVQGQAGRVQTILVLAILLTIQFFVSEEIFASGLLFAGIGWWLAILLLPPLRPGLRALLGDLVAAGFIVILAASPFLRAMLADPGGLYHPAYWPVLFSTDLANLVIPTQLTAFGGALFAPLSSKFTGGLEEQGAYLDFLVLLILSVWVVQGWQYPARKLWTAMFAILVLFSLGPVLHVAGVRTMLPLPWALIVHVPALGAALPARFCLYLSLLAAIGAACWVADGGRSRLWLAGLAWLFCLPAPHITQPNPEIAFFTTPGRVAATLGPGAKILVTPFGITGPSMLWQAEQKFGFRVTGGYLGYPPAPELRYPAVLDLFQGLESPQLGDNIKLYCAATGTNFIVVAPGTSPALRVVLAALPWPARQVDDVLILTVPHG